MTDTEQATWAESLLAAIVEHRVRSIDRIEVLAEAASTQDAARELARGRPGLMVVAGRQTAGRARLGRSWDQGGDLGLAATFVLSRADLTMDRLSLTAGVAAALAIEATWQGLGVKGKAGVRWPNDVVERSAGGRGRGGAKLAGVLIEAADSLALVGVGINVNHETADFAEPLRPRAASIRSVARARGGPGGPIDRLSVACHLLVAMDRAISTGFPAVEEWSQRDVLAGAEHTFRHNGRTVKGRVVAIDPLNLITIRTESGERVQLPALTTSLVQEA